MQAQFKIMQILLQKFEISDILCNTLYIGSLAYLHFRSQGNSNTSITGTVIMQSHPAFYPFTSLEVQGIAA